MRWSLGRVPSIVVLAVGMCLTASCRSSGDAGRSGGPAATEQPRQGGTIVISVGEPVCGDWYGQCGAGNFGIVALQTLPSPIVFVAGKYSATPLLTGEPSVDPGPPQRVTYRINPTAVWSDGTPITSSDFRYTWEQGRPTNVRGMADISSVDDTDPRTAVVTWKEPNPTWRERFRPILPKHLLDGKDRNAEMKDGYRFSGGPWMVDHWTRGQELKLVRNPAYWGTPTNLDGVVLRVIPDPAAARQAYKSNQIDMLFQGGAELNLDEMRGLPDTGFEQLPAVNYSFISFNNQSAPLDRKAVRQALAYATDRDAIVTQLQGNIWPGARPVQSLVSLANPDWYSEPFARYRRDLAKVAEVMRADGWAKGGDGVWVRGDLRARIELLVDASLHFHTLFSQIVESQWKEAGFEVNVKRALTATINVELLPKGDYQAAFTGAGATTTDPGQCVRFCSKNIPTEATRFVGGNVSRISNPVLDDVWGRADTELDTARRRELVRMGQEALADELPVLPLSSILDVYVFNNRKIGGPVAVGPGLATLPEWFCRTTCA
jgi:peptide/nickel transport system substrate-binding protein